MRVVSSFFLLLLLVFVGCNKSDNGLNYQNVDFEVHIQHNFDNDHVVVELDGNVVFDDDDVTTSQVLGLAKIVPLQAFRGTHHVRAILNPPDGINEIIRPVLIREFVVDLNDPTYICLTLTKSSDQIFNATVKSERPMYD